MSPGRTTPDDPERSKLWRRAFAALVAIANGWTRNPADSEDLAQRALTEAWTATPDETDVAALVRRAALAMKGHLSNQRRAAKRRGDERWRGVVAEKTGGLRRTPEQIAATREHKEQLLVRLRQEVADDPEACALLDETLMDHTTAAEQAEGLGWEIGRVRNARKRLDRAVKAVEAEDAAPESARGWDAVEQEDEAESGAES
jgi:DNA-directed RNA polymerase specialized sigma24 family protein